MTFAPFAWLQHLLPHRLMGACVRRLSHSRSPFVSRLLIHWFARRYAVDLGDTERSSLADFSSFNDFFTRALRAGARPLAPGEATVISPADGCVTEFGTASDGRALQAKGMPYRLEELLGDAPPTLDSAVLGDFLTVYLAPYDYHRVHLPLGGILAGLRYIPGRRFSVNHATAAVIPRLFCRNERLVLWWATDAGPIAVVLVGALNVAGISTPWLGEIRATVPRYWHGADVATGRLERGVEIGRFNLGSTVVVVLPRERMRWEPGVASGCIVRMGMRLGSIAASGAAA